MILLIFSWRAFSLHIQAEMEDVECRPLTYDTFWIFFMAREVEFTTLTRLFHDLIIRRRFKSNVVMTFIFLFMLFIMAWPTIAGAMTGYDSNNTAFVNMTDGTQVQFSDFEPVLYIIHDGKRVNLTDDYIIPYWNNTSMSQMFSCLRRTLAQIVRTKPRAGHDPVWSTWGYVSYDYCSGYISEINHNDYFVCNVSDCKSQVKPLFFFFVFLFRMIKSHTLIDVQTYGFYGLNDTESVWESTGAILPQPVLNISAFYVGEYDYYYGNIWMNEDGIEPFSYWSNMTYTYNNSLYNLTYIETEHHGVCQPNGVRNIFTFCKTQTS